MATRRTVALLTATSNSGRSCLKALLSRRERTPALQIRAAARKPEGLETVLAALPPAPASVAAQCVERFAGVDAAQPQSLTSLFAGADAALIVTPLDHARGFSDDARLTRNMIDAAVNAGVRQIVYVGSWTVTAADRVPGLAGRFVEVEDHLLRGLPEEVSRTSLRGGYFNTNFLHTIDSIKNGKIPLTRNFAVPTVHVSDIGRCAAAILADPEGAAKHNGAVYEMSGPEVMTAHKISRVLSEELGYPVEPLEFNPADMVGRMPPALVELNQYLMEAGESGVPLATDVMELTGQHSSFRDFVRENLGYFRKDPDEAPKED